MKDKVRLIRSIMGCQDRGVPTVEEFLADMEWVRTPALSSLEEDAKALQHSLKYWYGEQAGINTETPPGRIWNKVWDLSPRPEDIMEG